MHASRIRRVVLIWFHTIFRRHGESRLLAYFIEGLERIGIEYRILTLYPRRRGRTFEEIEDAVDKGLVEAVRADRGAELYRALCRLAIEACKLSRDRECLVVVRNPNEYFLVPYLTCLLMHGVDSALLSMGFFGLDVVCPRVLGLYRDLALRFDANRKSIKSIVRTALKRLPLRSLVWFLTKCFDYRILSHTRALNSLFMVPNLRSRMLGVSIAIDTDFFSFRRKRPYSEPRLLTVSRIAPEKNLEIFVKIVQVLQRVLDGVEGYIVGHVEDQVFLKRLLSFIERRGARVRIDVRDDDEVLRDYYWSSSVLVNVSEGALGLVNAEAASCGSVPVVHPYFVDGATPYAVFYSRYREVVPRLVRLFENSSELEERGAKCAEYVRRHYSVEAFVNNLLRLLSILST